MHCAGEQLERGQPGRKTIIMCPVLWSQQRPGRAPCAQTMPNARCLVDAHIHNQGHKSKEFLGFSQKATSPEGWPGIVSYILTRACHWLLRFVIVTREKIVQELGNDVR